LKRKILGFLGILLILLLSVLGYIESNAISGNNTSVQPPYLTFAELNLTPPTTNQTSPPLIMPLGNRTVNQGELLTIEVNATDSEKRPLSYYVSTLPPGALFDPKSRIFSWTPSEDQLGTFGVVFTVFNGMTIAQERVAITVRPSANRTIQNRSELTALMESFRSLPTLENGIPVPYNTSRMLVVEPGQSIQAAIDLAHDGDVIVVNPGVYRENLNIDKSVALFGRDNPVLDAGKKGCAVSLTIGGTVIDGFTINNSGSSLYDSGIKVSSNRNVIRNNTITGNQYGIYFIPLTSHNEVFHNHIYNNTLDGISGTNMQEDTVIASNQILNNGNSGVDIAFSHSLEITGNLIGFNGARGIALNRSIMNLIRENTIQNNVNEGISLVGGGRNSIEGNILKNNLESGIMIGESLDPDLKGNQITPWTFSDSLIAVKDNSFHRNHGPGLSLDSVTALVENNSFRENQYGIKMRGSVALVTRNNVTGNSLGIFLLNSGNSSLVQNTLTGNQIGIYLQGRSGDNIINMNTAGNNSISGILLEVDTKKNLVRENIVTNNTEIGLASYGQNLLEGNNVVFNGQNVVFFRY
jgi:parallel beta-helix repeat protein